MYHVTVDCHDLPSQARFWAEVLDWKILYEADDEIVVGAHEHALPGLCFVPVPESKTVKNRLHLDLTPDDQEAEVARILALGARRIDLGQGPGATWVTLADPEGNEFCVLRPMRSLTD